MLIYMLLMSLLFVAMVVVVRHVSSTQGIATAFFSLSCPPYGIREIVRAARQKRSVLVGLAATAVSTSIWISILFPMGLHPLVALLSQVAQEDPMMALRLVLALLSGYVWIVGVQWQAMIAFDREGWLPGFVTILFWPYGIYYGIKTESMNRMPFILSAAGLSGLMLFILLPFFIGS
jgi:hypothetical protein